MQQSRSSAQVATTVSRAMNLVYVYWRVSTPESGSQSESRPRVFVIGFSCIGQSSPSFEIQVAKVGSVSVVVGLQSLFAKFPTALEKFGIKLCHGARPVQELFVIDCHASRIVNAMYGRVPC